MTSEWAIEVEGLGKAYRMYPRPAKRIAEALTLGRYKGHHEFWALKNIDFKLRPGGSFGLCGANGAGKSTLLKTLAGTTSPTTGRFRIHGRVASLLELGAGFHGDFTGRANILVNGIMMGLTRREVLSRVDEIIEFAELGDYIDEPVRTYSSGMGLRLGFACALAVDPDVMIIDEVFAVGDMYFQKKCIDRVYELRKTGKTILFCSHSLYDIRQLCDEAIWIRDGEAAAIGDSVTVTNDYTTYQRHHLDELEAQIEQAHPQFTGRDVRELPEIRDARIYRAGTDEEAYSIDTGESIEIRVWWRNPDPAGLPMHVAAGFLRTDMTTCGGMATHFDGVQPSGPEGCTVIRIPNLKLLAGQFLVPVILFDESGVHKYCEYLLPENLIVRNPTKEVGIFTIEREWILDAGHPLPKNASGERAEGAAPEEGAA